MSLKSHFERGFAHGRWADEQLLPYISDAPERAQRLWAHTLSTPLVWVSRLAAPEVYPPVWPEPSTFNFKQGIKDAYYAVDTILDSYGPNYDHVFAFRTTKGAPFEGVVSDILQHLLVHSHYHRGQINLLLKDAGTPPPAIDYIIFSRIETR